MPRSSAAQRAALLLALPLAPVPAAAQGTVTVDAGAIRLPVPAGWQRGDADGRIRLAPPEAPAGDRVVLVIEQPVSFSGPFVEWFPGAWLAFSRSHSDIQLAGPVREMHASAGHTWALISAAMRDPAGRPIYVAFYAAARGGAAQVVVYAGHDYDLWRASAPVIFDALENGVRFLDQPVIPPVPVRGRVFGTPGGSPLGPAVPDPLDGIYTGLVASRGFEAYVGREYVTFYPDGRVFRRLPEGGLDGFDRDSAERDVPTLWGRYQRVAQDQWQIVWNGWDYLTPVRREGAALRYDGNLVSRLPTCEELTLDGAYDLEVPDASVRWGITFTTDGRFRDDSVIGVVAYRDLNAMDSRRIHGGAGRYRIGRNTLRLDYADSRTVLVAFFARCDVEPGPRPERIWINGTALVRRGP